MTDAPLKVGIVGCGGISKTYTYIYASLADLAQVVAVADVVDGLPEKRAQSLSDAYQTEAYRSKTLASDTLAWISPGKVESEKNKLAKYSEAASAAADVKIRTYRTYEDLLKDDEVQVLVLLTPPTVRAAPTIAAAESGRHVFTEGPIARSVQEADAMIAAITRAGVKLHSQVADRYPRGMQLAKNAVASGLMGKMGSATVENHLYHPQTYYEHMGLTQWGTKMVRDWMGTWEGEGGGAIFHHGRYIVDPFLWIVSSRVAEVYAYSGPMLRRIETDSLTHALLRFENGASGMINFSMISHAQSALKSSRGTRGRIVIDAENASIALHQENTRGNNSPFTSENSPGASHLYRTDVEFASSDNPTVLKSLESLRQDVTHIPDAVPQHYQTRLFLESIINDTEPRVPIDVARHHLEVTRAIYKSAEERQNVTLPLDKNDPFYSFEGRLTGGKAPSTAKDHRK